MKKKIIIPIIVITVIGIIIAIIISKNRDVENKKEENMQIIGQWGYFSISSKTNSGYLKYFIFEEDGKAYIWYYPIKSGQLSYKELSVYSGTYQLVDTKIIANLKAIPFDEKDYCFSYEYDDNGNFKLYEEVEAPNTTYGRYKQPLYKDNWENIYNLIKENNFSTNILKDTMNDRNYGY